MDGFASAYAATPFPSATVFIPDGNNFTCFASGARVLTSDQCNFTSSQEGSKPTWTAGLDYKLQPDLLLYGKVSRGYKAGGFNTNAVRPETRTFGPESVTAYELGFKSDFTIADKIGRAHV